jgi:hypothetical protein
MGHHQSLAYLKHFPQEVTTSSFWVVVLGPLLILELALLLEDSLLGLLFS